MEKITLSELINQSYPTDEMLETHGNLTVVDSYYSKRNNVLVVSFDKKIN